MAEEKEGTEKLKEINLLDFQSLGGSPEGEEAKKEAPEGEEPEKEAPEEPEYVEISLSTKMLIGMVGYGLSMKYWPDKKAMKEFSHKYRKDLPDIIKSFGMEELFDEVVGSTVSFKVKKTDIFDIPLPGWVGLAGVLGVLVVAGFAIKVPSVKDKTGLHKDMRGGKEHTLGPEGREKEGKERPDESEITG